MTPVAAIKSTMSPGGTNEQYITFAPVFTLHAKFLEELALGPPKQFPHCSATPMVAESATLVRGRTTATVAAQINRVSQRFMIASLSLGER
jgi:hypothetical protein